MVNASDPRRIFRAIRVLANRPQLTYEEAESATREVYLGDWTPWKEC